MAHIKGLRFWGEGLLGDFRVRDDFCQGPKVGPKVWSSLMQDPRGSKYTSNAYIRP